MQIHCQAVFHVLRLLFSTEFLIQYEDSLHHRGHWHNLTEVPGTKTTAHLKLSPYVHYTFRVLALNAVGFSQPSLPSRMFKTDAAGTNLPSLGFELLIGASFLFFFFICDSFNRDSLCR